MNNSSTTKTWLMSLGIIVAAVAAYYLFFANTPVDTSSLLQSSPQNNLAGAEVLSLLNQIRALQIDTNFFQDPAFTSLQDYSVVIPPQNVGRANPFAPLPGIKSASPVR